MPVWGLWFHTQHLSTNSHNIFEMCAKYQNFKALFICEEKIWFDTEYMHPMTIKCEIIWILRKK